MAAVRTAALMSEIERQEEYLAELPPEYEFPLFSGKQAVESQRKSGYKDTARAAREIVDNAYEAGAKNVRVVLDRPSEADRGKSEKRDSVVNIAFIDDAPGMRPKMIQYALTWGGGTHFKEAGKIGKFGFGLPNSSINQTRRLEVYSKTEDEDSWSYCELDINEVPTHGLIRIQDPKPAALPAFVQQYLKKNNVKLSSGTIVVWSKPDRLTFKLAAHLREHLLQDFGVTYRNLLKDFTLRVDGIQVQSVDPLFLMSTARFYKAPEDGGAQCTFEKTIAVAYWRDEATGGQHLKLLDSKADLDAARKDKSVTVGTIRIRTARFPYGFVLGGKKDKALEHLIDEHAKERFVIRRPRRGMAFVRSGREIDTHHLFPADKNLGDWPVLQSYALHWGMEVSFDPVLDEAFGIGNDKQSVRPIEDFWVALAEAGVAEAAHAEQAWQRDQRDKKRGEAAARERENPEDAIVTEAAQQAADTVGEHPLGKEAQEKAKARVRERAREKAQEEEIPIDEAEKAIQEEANRKRYRIAFFEAEGGVFLRPSLGDGLQRIAEINKAHPFFKSFYAPLSLQRNTKARNAVDLLLIALVDAELTMTGNALQVLASVREDRISKFLRTGLQIIDQMQPDFGGDEEDE